MLEHVESLALSVADYESWVLRGKDDGEAAVANCVRHLSALLASVIKIDQSKIVYDDSWPDLPLLDEIDRETAYRKLSRMPFQYYSEVDDPFALPSSDIVVGDLHDDLADIFADVVGSLRLFEGGLVNAAGYNWTEEFRTHWSYHLFSAMSILNRYTR